MSSKDSILRQLHLRPPSLALSAEVQARIDLLFHPGARERAQWLLEEKMGNNLFFGPFFTQRSLLPPDSPGVEQARFAALKLSDGDPDKLQRLIEDSKGNVVELISMAGLGTPGWKQWMPKQVWK